MTSLTTPYDRMQRHAPNAGEVLHTHLPAGMPLSSPLFTAWRMVSSFSMMLASAASPSRRAGRIPARVRVSLSMRSSRHCVLVSAMTEYCQFLSYASVHNCTVCAIFPRSRLIVGSTDGPSARERDGPVDIIDCSSDCRQHRRGIYRRMCDEAHVPGGRLTMRNVEGCRRILRQPAPYVADASTISRVTGGPANRTAIFWPIADRPGQCCRASRSLTRITGVDSERSNHVSVRPSRDDSL